MTHATHAAAAPRNIVFGKHIPNLVLIWDSEAGKDPEFRVQLEVSVDAATAKAISENLWGLNPRTGDKVREAKKLVLGKVPGTASARFKNIIAEAFDDQPEA